MSYRLKLIPFKLIYDKEEELKIYGCIKGFDGRDKYCRDRVCIRITKEGYVAMDDWIDNDSWYLNLNILFNMIKMGLIEMRSDE